MPWFIQEIDSTIICKTISTKGDKNYADMANNYWRKNGYRYTKWKAMLIVASKDG